MRKIIFLIILSVFVFSIIYNISFKSIEKFSTGRISVFLLITWVIFATKNKYWKLLFKKQIILCFVPFPYVIVQFFFATDSIQLSRFTFLFIFSFLGAFLIAIVSKDTKFLLQVILSSITIQALIIIYSVFNIDYRFWLDSIVVQGGNLSIIESFRAPGFSNSSGAELSLAQSLGVFTGWLLLNNEEYSISRTNSIFIITSMILCAISCIPTGRTGLILTFIFIAIFLLKSSKKLFTLIPIFIITAIIFIVFSKYIDDFLPSQFSTEKIYSWAFGFLTGEDVTIDNLSKMPIPKISVETFLGTGLIQNQNGIGNASGHDSGFIQTYYSMGLFFTIIFYIAYFNLLWHINYYQPWKIRFLLSAIFLILETKEPFVFKYIHMFVLMSIYFSFEIKKLRESKGEKYENTLRC